jgi:hypothetical protein
MCQELRAQADAEDGLVLAQRGLDRDQLRLQVRMPMLVHHVHRTTQHDEPVVALDVRLRIGMPLEIMEANAMAAGTDARIQRAQGLGGHMLEDHQS